MEVRRILILGGYGNFGKRIAAHLSRIPGLTLLIAGRTIARAAETASELNGLCTTDTQAQPCCIDIMSPDFRYRLAQLEPDLVIHTSGPFQGQDYRVPEACIACGSHYIDLADDRRFVCDIGNLHQAAKEAGVLIVSGASSVPGLSSTVIDHFLPQFAELREIDFAIAPGNKAERGEVTLRGILSYTGHPFRVLRNGQWVNTFGWMAPRHRHMGKQLGKRWLADINIPDLELFPQRYSDVGTVRFQAGLELPVLHFGMVTMAWMARLGLIKNWSTLTGPIFKASEWFKRFGSDNGGMQITLLGTGHNNQPLQIDWTLTAPDGIGPHIPTMSALILAEKLIKNTLMDTGATACLGLYSLNDFDQIASTHGIRHVTEVSNG